MLDESDHVEHLVADLAAQDFAGELEVIVADGGSTDGSVEHLERAARNARLSVEVIANPRRWVSPGLNACIRRASGDLIARLDCHTRYPIDYLRRCAEATEETGAWVVGGLVVPVGRSPQERAVACALDSPFGGTHWTRHGRSERRVETDTVYLGAFRPMAFQQAGLFDETLVRNQDDDLAYRIRAAGGRIVLDPQIRANYYPSRDLAAVFRQYYEYGFWKTAVMRKHRTVLTGRSLAPIAFVMTLAGLGVAATHSRAARTGAVTALGAYAAIAVTSAALSIERRGENWRLLPYVSATFPAFHLGYGLGMLRSSLIGTSRF